MIISATGEISQNCKFKTKQEKTTTTAALLFESEQLQLLCMQRKRIYRNLNPQNSFNIAKWDKYEVHQKTEKDF
jgi:hypothetical protein